MARKTAAKQSAASNVRKSRPVVIGAFLARPRLLASFGAGAVAWLNCALLTKLEWSTSAIIGWDACALVFIAAMIAFMAGKSPAQIRRQAAGQDEGQGVILAVIILAAAFSVAAVGVELSTAKGDHGLEKAWRVALAIGTVAASWFMVHLIFALHYAHEYYAPEEPPTGKGQVGGLIFPGGEEPDYWDFLHFSTVIGVAAQTADIAFASKPLRRIGTLHGIVAFTFNTVVLALTISLLAGLFGGD